jgi:hypothetical protein
MNRMTRLITRPSRPTTPVAARHRSSWWAHQTPERPYRLPVTTNGRMRRGVPTGPGSGASGKRAPTLPVTAAPSRSVRGSSILTR